MALSFTPMLSIENEKAYQATSGGGLSLGAPGATVTAPKPHAAPNPFDNATNRTMAPRPPAPRPPAPRPPAPSPTAKLPDGKGADLNAAAYGGPSGTPSAPRDPDGQFRYTWDPGQQTGAFAGTPQVDPATGQLTWSHEQAGKVAGTNLMAYYGNPTTGPWSAFRYEPDPSKYMDQSLSPGQAARWMGDDRMMANIERRTIGAKQLDTRGYDAAMRAYWGNAYARGGQSPEERALYARAQQGDGSSRATFNAALLGQLGARQDARNEQAQFRAGQLGLMNTLQAQAAGRGLSAAQKMLATNRDEAIAQANALAASQRGVSPAAALRMAQQSSEAATLKAGRDMAAMRAQEQLSAQQQLGALTASGRGADLSTYGADIENMRARTAASLGAAGASTASFGAETGALQAAAQNDLARDNMVMDWVNKGAGLTLDEQRNQTAYDAAKWQAKLGFAGLGADTTRSIVGSQQAYDAANRQAILDMLALQTGQYDAAQQRDQADRFHDDQRFDTYLGAGLGALGTIAGGLIFGPGGAAAGGAAGYAAGSAAGGR